MRINIIYLANKKGRNLTSLAEEVGCTYKNLWKLCNGKTNSIKFNVLERLCKILECGVEDILVVEEESEDGDYSI
jgi:putative transcriptional regulator